MSKGDEVREQIADILDENLLFHSVRQGKPVFILKNNLLRIADQILALKGIAVAAREAELPVSVREIQLAFTGLSWSTCENLHNWLKRILVEADWGKGVKSGYER